MDTGKLIDSMKRVVKSELGSYDTTATVKRVEGNTAWVHIPGGVDETPVRLTMNAKEGDNVQVRVSDGKAFLAGNVSAPPTDDTTAKAAKALANRAAEDAGRAKTAADIAESYATSAQASAARAEGAAGDAQTSATQANTAANGALEGLSTVQDVIGVLDWASKNAEYTPTSDTEITPGKTYWTRSGAGTEADPYVYTPVVNPVIADIGTYYEISGVDEAMADYINSHLALTDEGLYVLADNSEWKVLIASDGVYIQNSAGQTVGEFSKDGIRLGDVNGMNYMSITSGGLSLTLDGGLTDAIAAMLVAGDPSSWTTTENNRLLPAKTDQGVSVQNFYLRSQIAEGTTISFSVTLKSPADTGTTYTETYTFTQGSFDVYDGFVYEDKFVRFMYQGGSAITILNYYTWDTLITVATATYDIQVDRSEYFTFGKRRINSAIGKYSLAEGYNVEASGDYSHAEGANAIASAKEAHAEGNNTRATGDYSHAQNFYTKAASDYQTSMGKYNVEDSADTYAVIVGNGTADNARSNAATLDWSGNLVTAGDITDGTGNVLSDKIGEDANGDISITRNITAGGNVEAAGDVTDGAGNVLSSTAAHAVISTGSTGGWNYKKYADGTFEATRFSTSGATGTMTQLGSTGIYYSSAAEITFPSIGITGITSCLASVMPPSNYLMSYYMSRLTTAHVYFSYIRYGSGAAVTDISYEIAITGTYS